MPAASKTSEAEILAAARDILEARGLQALTMQAVAEAVGVRSPSLYKRFGNRDALLVRLELDTLARLREALVQADADLPPRASLEAQAHAFRRFATHNPRAYATIYSPDATASAQADAARLAAVRPALERIAALVGEEAALVAARTLTAYLHGFVTIEAAGMFRLGGDVEAAFDEGVRLVLDGIEAASQRRS